FLMAIFNPLILRFDIGFQLSFLALLGIAYLGPAIRKFFRLQEGEGFLGWRENFLATTSAQLAVAPFLIINFSQFSPLSLLANVLILEAIPPTMFLGFLIGFLGLLSYYFSLIIGWLVGLFLAYELFIINLFGATRILEIHSAGLILVVGYYIFLIGFALYNKNIGSFKATEGGYS
ncbi:MAG: ComEC/Rec2 family competence protein, partial [Candidatus Magasanikbacteria bacterium]|nr:ComEC/Rec2 family competence protein [Candidatus Magasanikbacteria bacterium]